MARTAKVLALVMLFVLGGAGEALAAAKKGGERSARPAAASVKPVSGKKEKGGGKGGKGGEKGGDKGGKAADKGEGRDKPEAGKAEPADAAAAAESAPIRRGERIEFDARLIQGQTAKAGAVYLFERKSSDLRSMVKERTSYRREIVRAVFPDEGGTP